MAPSLFILDIATQFSFYKSYHNTFMNVLLHSLFVWPIFCSFLLLLAFWPPLLALPLLPDFLPGLQLYLQLNWAFVLAASYGAVYIYLDFKSGSLAAALCLAGWVGSNALSQRLDYALACKAVLWVQIISWSFLGVGHGIFERSGPNPLEFIQATLLSPFFVVYEVLRGGFGYEPYPGFEEAVKKGMQERAEKLRASSKKFKD